jgi:hypothetical protein
MYKKVTFLYQVLPITAKEFLEMPNNRTGSSVGCWKIFVMKPTASRMDEILERLLRQHPEAVPIRRSKYIPDCHVGWGRVWRAGQPVVTGSLVVPEEFIMFVGGRPSRKRW